MDSNLESTNPKGGYVSVYKKLHADGTPDNRPILQSDYDQVTDFIKQSFPKATRVQREIDQTLKRTFVLGRTETKNASSIKGAYLKKSSMDIRKGKQRLKNKVPKKLLYEDFAGLNLTWKSYVEDVLQGENQPQTKMNRLDFHGALIKVVESNCKDYENLNGIIVKESRNVFVIVTKTNFTKCKGLWFCIPKRETIFDVELSEPKGIMRLSGNSLLTRPSERACKKIKSFMDFMSPKVYKAKLRYSDHNG